MNLKIIWTNLIKMTIPGEIIEKVKKKTKNKKQKESKSPAVSSDCDK